MTSEQTCQNIDTMSGTGTEPLSTRIQTEVPLVNSSTFQLLAHPTPQELTYV